MLSLQSYLADPCGAASLPYWKQKEIVIPDQMRIVHDRNYVPSMFPDADDEPYFKLSHDLKVIETYASPDIQIMSEPSAIDEFVSLINASYDDLGVTAEQMARYQQTSVFHPDLWVLLREKGTGTVLGGGIADYDSEAREVSLEWIQVLPACRKRGYGRMIVNHLLATMQGEARFATVSGKVNNPSCPEKLYRQCGFAGQDVWHILTLK